MNQRVIIFALIIALVILVAGILLLYSCEKKKQEEIRKEEKSESGNLDEMISVEEEPAVTSKVQVKLYFRSPRSTSGTLGLLKPAILTVTTSPEKRVFLLKILEALIKGPESGSYASVPRRVKVRQIFLVDTLAVIDFSRDISDRHPGGVLEELATIYSITNTVTENVPGIKRVRILVEGEERETLAGHISLSRDLYHSPKYIVGWKVKETIIQEENLQ